jgi:hypothetical protein
MQTSFFDYAMDYQGKRGRPSTPVKILIGALFLQAEKAIFADSGYMSQDRKRKLRSKGIFNAITERRVRGQSKLRPKQSKNNTKFSKVRALVT